MYFDQTERKIINENNSLYATRMRMLIELNRLKKSIMKTYLGLFLSRFLKSVNSKSK